MQLKWRRWTAAFLAAAAVAVAAEGALAQNRGNTFAGAEELPEVEGGLAQGSGAPLPSEESSLLALARDGNIAAEIRVGVLYLTGKGVRRDPAEGVRWMRMAAEKGDSTAEGNLATILFVGLGVPKDYGEAVKWYRLAAEQGNVGAELGLGIAYERGLGVSQNFVEAMRWYRRAAEHGNGTALNNLGVMYQKGEGVPVDQAEAVKWLRRAADRNVATAQALLGIQYFKGAGVAEDKRLAYFWLSIAASHAAPKIAGTTARIRDAVARTLSADEINGVQSAVARWNPGVDAAALMPSPGGAPGSAGPSSSGTGFIVSRSGQILTNAHVVQNCRQIGVRRPGAGDGTAKLAGKDERNDLALLDTETPAASVATFRDDHGVRQGENVVAYGFPLSGLLSSEGNLTVGTVSALAGYGNDSRLLQISVPVQPGNSGGPLIDASGNVVGVIASKLNALSLARTTGDVAQNVNFAIKASVARDFLDANDVSYQTARSGRELKTPDLAEAMKRYTVSIVCRN